MITFRMEIDCQKKSGTRQDKKTNATIPYFIYLAYASLPGFKHPQAVEHYSEQPLPLGTILEIPVNPEVSEGKVRFTPDYRAAKLVAPPVQRQSAAS